MRSLPMFVAAVAACTAMPIDAATVVLNPSRDATIFSDVPAAGQPYKADGAGPHLFFGRLSAQGDGELRRALIAFDLAAIPAGSTIHSASLTLFATRVRTGEHVVRAHRITTAWTEGPAVGGFAAQGAAAAAGDVTWVDASTGSAAWTAPGGDYVGAASFTGTVGALGALAWTNEPGLLADIRSWVDAPHMNHGWIFIGDEGVERSAKQLASAEFDLPAEHPVLRVEFTPVPEPTAGLLLAAGLGLLGAMRLSARR